ncbi:hypothetical protein [Ornithinimicrobium kibberense]|uniref:hypothetical protein n=1 Tax=Ornithinimicrobium kibberense TaxID=282060 RepID=UPI00361E4A43
MPSRPTGAWCSRHETLQRTRGRVGTTRWESETHPLVCSANPLPPNRRTRMVSFACTATTSSSRPAMSSMWSSPCSSATARRSRPTCSPPAL